MYRAKDRIVRVRWKKGKIPAISFGRIMDAECMDATNSQVIISTTDYMSSMEEPEVMIIPVSSKNNRRNQPYSSEKGRNAGYLPPAAGAGQPLAPPAAT